ncbi:MAG: hypothetical protein IPP68_10055 [Elusimicrobia bacterium]|nr:hypothetical protein [Elusimicrobiota bacterium]
MDARGHPLTVLPVPAQLSQSLFRRRWAAALWTVLFGAAGVYAVLWLDTGARAREAYREAERYTAWAADPAKERRDADEDFRSGQARLAREKNAGRLSPGDFTLEMDLLRERHALTLSRPPSGLAAQWYQDTYRLFAPPENRWTRAARLMAPALKERWRRDVAARKLPTRPTHWDEEPGLAAGERVVYSARRWKEADRARAILEFRGIPARVGADPRPAGAGDGVWVVVPAARFADAHAALRDGLALSVPTIVIQ